MTQAKTRYPILLVHGMGVRDDGPIGYWGRIPKTLEELGCAVFLSGQDCNALSSVNAAVLARRVDEVLAETGAEKVNIIAHSKGGLDSRCLISTLGAGEKIASLTTLATPHHGSKTVDLLLKFPDPLVRLVGGCTDWWMRRLGDKEPSTYRVFHDLTTPAAKRFNEANPDYEGTFYQSYAFVMKSPFSDLTMFFPGLLVRLLEGENDGLLTPEAMKWTNFKGTYRGTGRRGISHCDEVDARRSPLAIQIDGREMDLLDLYRQIAGELAQQGC